MSILEVCFYDHKLLLAVPLPGSLNYRKEIIEIELTTVNTTTPIARICPSLMRRKAHSVGWDDTKDLSMASRRYSSAN